VLPLAGTLTDWLAPGTIPVSGQADSLPAPGPTATAAARSAQTPPYAIVLGTAQDAGVPQVNCFNDNCNAVRSGARPAPRVASLGLVDPHPDGAQRFMIDATPDFVAEAGDLLAQPDGTAVYEGSIALADALQGILLTHAHMGHYTGLIHLGREGAATRELPLYVSASMAAYLRANEPWAFLVRNGHVVLRELTPGTTVQLSPRLSATPFSVVHRQELSDTLGFLVHGPDRTLMYVPDADRWEGWPSAAGAPDEEAFEHWLGRSDVALLDGSFYSYDELPNRPQAEVPHPPVSVTMDLLANRPHPEVFFIHLNNTNPLWDPAGPENTAVRTRGFAVAEQGQRISL
jgi:pyrroloquinoline quinone biosynthesis protein B